MIKIFALLVGLAVTAHVISLAPTPTRFTAEQIEADRLAAVKAARIKDIEDGAAEWRSEQTEAADRRFFQAVGRAWDNYDEAQSRIERSKRYTARAIQKQK